MPKIKQPKIRFKGYIANWEQYKLGKVCKVTMGCSPSSLNYTDNPNDYILVQGNADMKNGRVFPRVYTTQVTKTAEPNDIILSVRAPVGDVGKTDFNVVLGRGVAGIKGNDFIHQYLIKMKEQGYWIRYSTGSTFESINSNDLKDAIINIPNIEEQNKIGEFFKTLDDTITLHQQKLEVTKQLKQTMLKKMFPKNGKTKPEIRFKGFNDDWEECMLGDFLYEVSKRGNSDLEFITVREFDTILRPQSNQGYGNIVTDSKKLKAKIILNGQFLIDLTSYSRGIYLSRLDGLTSNTYSVLELSEFGNLEFFTEFLKHPLFVSKLESLTPIGVRQGKKIDQNALLKSRFRIPHKEEQEVIGNYFKELDNQINALEKKLERYKEFKKAMLQKMFI